MVEKRDKFEEKLHRILMRVRQAPNSTGNSDYFLMFNRQIGTYLSLMATQQEKKP